MTIENFTPDNKVLDQLDGSWQKMFLFLLYKVSKKEPVSITGKDIEDCMAEFAPNAPVLFTHGAGDSVSFQVIDVATAEKLSKLQDYLKSQNQDKDTGGHNG